MSEDLWGTIPPADNNPTALSVLKEQGELLSEKTNGELSGSVVCRCVQVGGRDVLNFDFYIVCPTQNNYRYEVLSVHQPNFPNTFPAEVLWEDYERIVESMDEFKDAIRDILQSERVQKVLLHFLRREE